MSIKEIDLMMQSPIFHVTGVVAWINWDDAKPSRCHRSLEAL